MHITNLEITNFRGIKHLEIKDLKMVNIFLGKNNIGKTSILEAIFLSLAPGNPNVAVGIDNFRNLIHTVTEDFRFIFYQLDYENVVEINSTYRYDELEKGLKITPESTNSPVLNVQNEIKKNFDSLSSSGRIDNVVVNGLNLNYFTKKRHSKKEYSTAKVILNNGTFNQTPAKNPDPVKGVFVINNSLYANMHSRLEKLLINKQENILIDFLKPVDDTIQGLALGTNNIILVDTGFGKRFPINLLGDGVIKLIGILLAIYDADGGIVLVDEFSNGLHYTALKGLWKAIFKAADSNKVQIFLTTHDYEALAHLRAVLEEEDYKKFQPETRSYTIRRLPDGNFKSYMYDFPKLELAIEENNEMR